MALRFGYSNDEPNYIHSIPRLPRSLRYSFTYDSLSKSYKVPAYLRSGYPQTYISGIGITENSKLTLLTHVFDADNTLVNLKLRYRIRVLRSDNNYSEDTLGDIELFKKKNYANGIFQLNEEYIISEYFKGDLSKIVCIYIQFKQISDGTYGNESTLDMVVDY